MSDHVLKIVPTDRRYVPAPETHASALKLLLQLAPGEMPEVRASEKLLYIDAGEALEWIVCPKCRSRLNVLEDPHQEWCWAIEKQVSQQGVESVTVTVPCCKTSVPFGELDFEDGAIARFELVIWNPDVDEYQLPDSSMAQLEKALGCALKQVWAHY